MNPSSDTEHETERESEHDIGNPQFETESIGTYRLVESSAKLFPFKHIDRYISPLIENVEQSVIICAPTIEFAKLLFVDLYATLDRLISRGITISIVLGDVDEETRLKCSERERIRVIHTTISFLRSMIKVDNTLFSVNRLHSKETKDSLVWMLIPEDHDFFDNYNDELNHYFE